jgi:DNA-binding XRE family transcriptional regulator
MHRIQRKEPNFHESAQDYAECTDPSLRGDRQLVEGFEFMARGSTLMFAFPDLSSLRERAGVTRSELAREAGVDRATLARVESGRASRKETLYRLGNALNALHYDKRGNPIDVDKCVTAVDQTGERGTPSLRSVRP